MPELFHFLYPQWFWALLPLALLLWVSNRHGDTNNPWAEICDRQLLPWLLVGSEHRSSRLPLWLLAAGWLIAVIALADPVWEQQPQPVYRSQDASVVVLDLSRSMLSPDLPPSRLARARYKVADILRRSEEGQIGLVVFAGDAFAVSPLTNDADTVLALLKPLSPELMPVQGSRVDRGLELAGTLLEQAGAARGNILLVTDGFDNPRALEVARELHSNGYRVSVLGVGTENSAPVPDGQGGFLRDENGKLVTPRLNTRALQQLANAGGGQYRPLSGDGSDINALLESPRMPLAENVQATDLKTDAWQSRGPWLVLLLLPLAALAFRRGWLLVMLFMVGTTTFAPRPAMALGWEDLWLRRDQQAQQALESGEPEKALALAQEGLQRGTAAYRAGKYDEAVQSFVGEDNSDALYNRGNALAKLGRYEEAVNTYDKALSVQPDMTDARHNRDAVEKLLRQQQSDQKKQQGQQGQNSSTDSEQKDGASQSGESSGADEAKDSASATQSQGGEQDAEKAADGETREQTAAGEREAQQGEQGRAGQSANNSEPGDAQAAPQSTEEQLAAQQWLKRIPDDPGGLLRRKFLYQYRQRANPSQDGQQAW